VHRDTSRPDCFLGVDLGTSGCRGVAIDAAATVVAEARTTLPASRQPGPGAFEQSAGDWWAAVREVLGRIAATGTHRPRALSVDGTSSTLLLCDAGGTPLTPALMYNDARARDKAARIARFAPADSPARGPTSALARLLYLLEQPIPTRPLHALHQADWIAGRLAGRFGISDENNALKLGYDPVARCWPDWIDELAVDRRLLPGVLPVGTPIGTIHADVAAELGLPDDLAVVAGTTDSNAATLAAGASKPGDAVTSLGSTLVLKVVSERPVSAARFGVYSHRLGDRWLVGGASNSGGAVLRRFFTDARLRELSRDIDPRKPTGLHYYPLPAPGERFPFNDPAKPPELSPRPANDTAFLQAILEGIADIEATGYRRLHELGAPYPAQVYTAGGGATNNPWRDIRARRLGIPVRPAAHTEAAYGAALLARDAVR